ncbi:CinA family protein, partial [Leucobacter sp. M11]|uniref:CinA family protein n=1 Tax=Leucobacter sp. M11 TaxID=2993565 RepID=UPI002D80BC36
MTLAAECIRLAAERGVRLAVAESLTGGLLCAELVRVPGASAAVSGGVVAYATELKASLLGVAEERLRETGPVDALVAEQMARGVRQACALGGVPADVGLATTGV